MCGLDAGGGHQQLAKAQARIRARLGPDRLEPLGHRGVALVGGQDALAIGNERARRLPERRAVLGHVPTPLPSITSRTEPSAITIDSVYASPSDTHGARRSGRPRDAGCSEKAPAAHELVQLVDALTVQARLGHRPSLVVALGREPPLHPAARRLCSAGRHQSFGGAADAHQQVRLPGREQSGERSGHVSVGRRDHRGAGRENPPDQLLVARLVEHHHMQIGDGLSQRRRQGGQVVLGAPLDVDGAACGTGGNELVHVEGGPERRHRAPLGDRDRGERAGNALCAQGRALERVDGDVELTGALAELLAGVEHRGVVLSPLADHDGAAPGRLAEHGTHRIGRRGVGRVRVATAHPELAGEGGRPAGGKRAALEQRQLIGRLRAGRSLTAVRHRVLHPLEPRADYFEELADVEAVT